MHVNSDQTGVEIAHKFLKRLAHPTVEVSRPGSGAKRDRVYKVATVEDLELAAAKANGQSCEMLLEQRDRLKVREKLLEAARQKLKVATPAATCLEPTIEQAQPISNPLIGKLAQWGSRIGDWVIESV